MVGEILFNLKIFTISATTQTPFTQTSVDNALCTDKYAVGKPRYTMFHLVFVDVPAICQYLDLVSSLYNIALYIRYNILDLRYRSGETGNTKKNNRVS